MNNSLKENKIMLEEKGYRTIGEMLHKDEKFNPVDENNCPLHPKKRNGTDDYRIMVYRADIEQEAKLILDTQFRLGNTKITSEFINEYIRRLSQQKSFDWNDDIIKMVGFCQFEPEKKRSARATLSSMKFIAFSRMNNIFYDIDGREEKLTPEQMQHLWQKALTIKSGLKFSHVREVIGGTVDKIRFNYVDYNQVDKYKMKLDYKDSEKNTKIRELELKEYHQLKDACKNYIGETTWNNLVTNIALYDSLATAITYNKDDEKIKNALTKCFAEIPNSLTLDERSKIIQAIIDEGVAFKENINLSLVATNKIIPYLELGYRYDEACGKAGYHHSVKKVHRKDKLPSLKEISLTDTITNPVVLRALSQMRKVVNALVAKYGSPYQINVELARDIGKKLPDRKKIEKRQLERREYNQTLINDFIEKFNKEPKASDLERYKLWKQQDGRLPVFMRFYCTRRGDIW